MKLKIIAGLLGLLVLVGAYLALRGAGALSVLADEQALRQWIGQLGYWGPATLISLLIVAIVMSPIPSGPIAMAAGAAYGPVWGTFYVVIGAEAGALIAFCIARMLGYEAVRRWSKTGPFLDRLGRERSQVWLMAVVFASRLVPFISFDALSYAAGLTPLTFWRFAIATLAGIIPISLLLTYSGEELMTAESDLVLWLVVALGGITLVPIVARLLWSWNRKRKQSARELPEQLQLRPTKEQLSRQDL